MSNTTQLDNFLGTGIAFPITLVGGKPVISNGTDLIKSSLQVLFGWPHGSRMFLEDFGCRLDELLEEQNDTVLQALIFQFITDAVLRYEKRVSLISLDVISQTTDKLNINIRYKINNTALEDGFIFPFYKTVKY